RTRTSDSGRRARDELHPRSAQGGWTPARRAQWILVSGSASTTVGYRWISVAVGYRERTKFSAHSRRSSRHPRVDAERGSRRHPERSSHFPRLWRQGALAQLG